MSKNKLNNINIVSNNEEIDDEFSIIKDIEENYEMKDMYADNEFVNLNDKNNINNDNNNIDYSPNDKKETE